MFSDIIPIHTIVDYNMFILHVICNTHFDAGGLAP